MIPRPTSLAAAQAVLFFAPGTRIQGSRVLRELPEAVFAQFDGEPVLSPGAQGPLQVQFQIPGLSLALPNVVLNRQDGTSQLTIGSQRVDLIAPTGQIRGSLEAFFAAACDTLLTVRRIVDVPAQRVAAIVHRFRILPTPARALAEQFCRESLMENGPLNRPEAFELHAHKVFRTASGALVNSWVRSRSAVMTATNTPAVSVEQDINTLAPDDPRHVAHGDDFVSSFFRGIAGELDEALALYYPDNPVGP
jgi:hypothetical protein